MEVLKRKIIIVGAGHVGSHAGYALLSQGLVEEIVYIDIDQKKAEAQALDLYDSTLYLRKGAIVRAGDYSDAKDAQLLIVAAGPLPDMSKGQTRMDTLRQTIEVLKDVTAKIKTSGFSGIILSISNPADVIAHYIQHVLDWPPEKVFSTSTTLDSARLRRAIAQAVGVDQKSVYAYALGEHGESQMVPWSIVTIAGKPLSQLMEERPDTYGKLDLDALAAEGKKGGWIILGGKGSTEFGIGSVLNILRADANPTAVEFMERNVVRVGEDFSGVRYPCPEAGSYILLTFDGREREVAASAERIQTLALSSGALDYIFLTDPQQAADIWKVRGALVKAVEAVSEQEPVDIVVPINRTAEFIGYINQLEQSSGMRMVSFGHAGDGNVHLCVVRGHRDEATWQKELHANMDKAYHKAYELGGIASGEHGIGISKRRYFLRETHWENLRAMNQIKDALDPLHILNDKKSYLVGGQDETAI